MAGLTDAPFRRLTLELGAGYAVAEMVSGKAELWHTDKSRLRRARAHSSHLNAQQIAGSDPEAMAETARRLEAEGADVVDINFGCPMKKVCRKAAGSALMREPELISRIVGAVSASVSIPVTVKMRTGWSPDERNAVDCAQRAEQAGARAVVVHGRTRACRFLGHAEYDTAREVKRAVRIPVIANGDIDSPEKAREVMIATGVDGVMVGRAAVGAPWLPGQIAGRAPLSTAERWAVVFEHLEGLYSLYGGETGSRIARKHVKVYLQNFGYSEGVVSAFNSLMDAQAQLGYLQTLETGGPGRAAA